MALIDAFVAVAEESGYGTAASLSRGVYCNPQDWALTEDVQRIMSTVRQPGQLAPSAVFAKAMMGVSGSGSLDLLDKGCGLLLKHGLGGFASASHPVESGTMKRFTITPDAAAKRGLSLTMQLYKAYLDTLGKAMTYTGVKVLGVRFMGDVGGLVRASFTLDGRDVSNSGDTWAATLTSGSPNITVGSTVGISPGMKVTGTGIPAGSQVKSITSSTVFVLGDSADASVNATANGAQTLTISRGTVIAKVSSPTYPSGAQPFSWNGVGITVDGVACCASGFEIGYDFTMRTDRRHMCNGGLKDEPVVVDISKATLTLKGLEALAPDTATGARQEYNRYMSITPGQSLANVVISCYTPAITSGVTKGKIEFQAPVCLATSGVPDMAGGQPADFDILGTPGLTVVYDTLDSAA